MIRTIEVTGSSGNSYIIIFNNDTGKLKASCSCQAGKHKMLCKHIINEIEANTEIQNMLQLDAKVKSDFEKYINCNILLEKVKNENKKIKKELANDLLY